MTKAYHSNGARADHRTPPGLIEAIRIQYGHSEFGGITRDVAAWHDSAVAKHYYTPEEDGLARTWSTNGLWWCNPPYGTKFKIQSWLEKANEEAARGFSGIMLVPARTGTKWWWEWVREHEVVFLPGRITFWIGARPLAFPAGFPSALVLMGPKFSSTPVTLYWDWRATFRNVKALPDAHPDLMHVSTQGLWHVRPWNPGLTKKLANGLISLEDAYQEQPHPSAAA